MSLKHPLALALLLGLCGPASLPAQEEPLTAGGEGVPVPKKTKHVQPVYPAEALAQGIRGIVILDIVIDARGKVASTSVLRSVAGLDEAAIAAARQWEYEPTKLDGKPRSVRLTVPITFSLALPKLTRQAGVPELRQGASPVFPASGASGGTASAEVTLEADGRVGAASLLAGEAPWSEALLAALKTWRFAPPPDDAVLSFRVEAEFVKAQGSEPNAVVLRATGLQRSELMAEKAPEAPAQTPAQAPQPATPAAAPEASPTRPPAVDAGAAPSVAAPQPATTAGASPAPASSSSPTVGAGAAAPPPVEVITAPPPAPPPENGISAVRDVTLEPGVPDLARGRRPVAPPLARMSATTGTAEVSFSVGAGGTTSLQTASGLDLLRYAAEQTVASWVFTRTRADRAYLTAVFSYGPDKGTAVVRPQVAPAAAKAPDAPLATPPTPPPSQR